MSDAARAIHDAQARFCNWPETARYDALPPTLRAMYEAMASAATTAGSDQASPAALPRSPVDPGGEEARAREIVVTWIREHNLPLVPFAQTLIDAIAAAFRGVAADNARSAPLATPDGVASDAVCSTTVGPFECTVHHAKMTACAVVYAKLHRLAARSAPPAGALADAREPGHGQPGDDETARHPHECGCRLGEQVATEVLEHYLWLRDVFEEREPERTEEFLALDKRLSECLYLLACEVLEARASGDDA